MGIKHPNPLLTQQIISVCQDYMSLRQRDGRGKILIRRKQVSGQFFGPVPNPHISKAVNQGLSVLPVSHSNSSYALESFGVSALTAA